MLTSGSTYVEPIAQDDFEAQLAAFDANTKAQQQTPNVDELDKLLSEL
ncbi:hypothetical protein ACTBAC_004704 [Vibrio parahaemolyticus]|nr:hypothetical protein [Vibrio parahaemolyticus]EIU7550381.1 hypothetical protein [Vibrio vulnificus]EIZ1898571.1 hypothetical protein [Vibrio parahaemolyticus]EIZ1900449.1 hypothetical protein [Vibrio parahaemolyticus]EJA3093939.1 hypothetical protein [Vibrio parahaemolyticus]